MCQGIVLAACRLVVAAVAVGLAGTLVAAASVGRSMELPDGD